jgi:penicillin amidase
MDYDRHRAYGRWAELAGPDVVEGDKLMRRFRLRASAEADYRVISDEARAMLNAYVTGVNAFIESTQSLPIEYKVLGIEPESWDPVDCLAIYKVRHVLMGTFEEKLWRGLLAARLGPEKTAELLPGYPKGDLMIVPPGAGYLGPAASALEELRRGAEAVNQLREFEAGSNSWALTGKRTATGKPLVCGDSHRALDTPSVYYQNHIACPDFDAIGFSFPGVPGFPHFGHNEHVAWCVTHACADYQDLFVERFKEDDPTQYEFKAEWKQAKVHRETIEVRGGDPVEMDVTVTQHGTIIAGTLSDGYALAFRYTGTATANDWANALSKQPQVRSVDDLEEAMPVWVDPCNNYVFADVHGDTCYLTRGKVPIRSKANRYMPLQGWTGEHEWEGFVPFEALPRVRNPEAGYIATANNRIVEKDEPYYIGMDYVPEFRARSIQKRLCDMTGATVEDMPSVHAERTSIPAQAYARLLRDVEPLDDLSSKARELLIQWDGRMDKDAVEPTIYSAFRDRTHPRPARQKSAGRNGPGRPQARNADQSRSTNDDRERRSLVAAGGCGLAIADGQGAVRGRCISPQSSGRRSLRGRMEMGSGTRYQTAAHPFAHVPVCPAGLVGPPGQPPLRRSGPYLGRRTAHPHALRLGYHSGPGRVAPEPEPRSIAGTLYENVRGLFAMPVPA